MILFVLKLKMSFKFEEELQSYKLKIGDLVMVKCKRIVLIAVMFVMTLCFAACSTEKEDDGKITIITTLFPQYDFAKQIVGDKCEVILLLPPGTEAHSYEPTPKDIININNAEMFIYTGDDMEAWVPTILDAVDNKDLKVVDVSDGIELINTGEAEHTHSHEDAEEYEEQLHEEELHEEENHEEEIHDEHEHSDENVFGHAHSHDIDPHFFTSPENAIVMMDTILEEVIALDPENAEYYRENCEAYISEIEKVDARLHEITENAENKTIYFGGKFAMLYFVNEYHLSYVSPFDSCSHEAEANPKDIVEIIECMREHGATTVFYEELADPKVANMIAGEIDGDTLLLHSCHNVSKDEFESGVTYVDLMNQNADNLEKGLK